MPREGGPRRFTQIDERESWYVRWTDSLAGRSRRRSANAPDRDRAQEFLEAFIDEPCTATIRPNPSRAPAPARAREPGRQSGRLVR